MNLNSLDTRARTLAPVLTVLAAHAQGRVRSHNQPVGLDRLEASGANAILPRVYTGQSLVNLFKLATNIAS